MAANVLVQTAAFAGFQRRGLGGHLAGMPRGLRGLSASNNVNFTDDEGLTITADPRRTEVSYADWVNNVNQQWTAANPEAAQKLKAVLMGSNILGIGLLVGGAVAFGLGQKMLGTVLGLAGAGGLVYSAVRTQTDVVGESILKVGG